ncbi:MAG TPA: hypothetical protein VGD14_23115 [bacterium]
MNHDQIQQEISIIKSMIEKTRRETAESGHLFIFMGIASAIFVLAVSMLEIYKLKYLVLPAMIVLTVINGIIGYLVVANAAKNENVKSYPRTIVLNLWVICGMTLLMMTFLFPFLKVYSFRALGTLVSLVLGIAVFMTGVIYEMRFIQWFSLTWWIGAGLLALIDSEFRFLILIATIIVGWIIPGIILNRRYRHGSKKNEA